ncbi:MAG: electron transfer flavoprotein subunit beta/FixA family protein [Myxococcales bacterium]|nr:electron transfer flavoprotein subunit beta/FixA family protein [Myxococcales bacterium]
MKILVTAKRVTDPNAKLVIDDDGSWIDDDVEYILNPFCENAVEAALQIASDNDAETIAIGIGDEEVQRYIRQGALARGVDRGIHVDAEEQELDSDLIAKILKAVVEREEPDMVLLGKQAVDGDSNQVGQLLAEMLGWPQATFASEVKVEGAEAIVTREVDGGLETLAVTLPAVITADLRLNDPRYASLAGIMKAKKKPLEELELDDLELDDEEPKVRVVKLHEPAGRSAGVVVADVDELLQKLTTEARVL